MPEELKFSIPETKKKTDKPCAVTNVLLIVCIVIVTANLALQFKGKTPAAAVSGLSAEQAKLMAGKLSERNLYQQAAKVWQDYLASGKLTGPERARTLFQIGLALEKAGQYGDAVESYYRSETAAKLDELGPDINSHIKDCFQKMGKFSALRYELMDRTSFKGPSEAGSRAVAEIGAEKITDADLNALVEKRIDNQLSPMAAFMTAGQLSEQKKKMLEEYKSPKSRQQFLQSWIAQEILYRQALDEQLAEKPEVKSVVDDVTRSILAQTIMSRQLADKINITDADLQTYYTANKDKYVEPAKAGISHILSDSREKADELLGRIKAGGDFAALAKEFSKDAGTKEKGGVIDEDVIKGSSVPVIGDANGLNDRIFAASPPKVLDEPVQSQKGWELVKVEKITPQAQKSFDEVKQLVRQTLLEQKQQQVQQDYIKEMMNKHNVIIHSSAFNDPNLAGNG